MATWRDEYLKALLERDEKETESYSRISEDFIDACKYTLDELFPLSSSSNSLSKIKTTTELTSGPKSPTFSIVPLLSQPKTLL